MQYQDYSLPHLPYSTLRQKPQKVECDDSNATQLHHRSYNTVCQRVVRDADKLLKGLVHDLSQYAQQEEDYDDVSRRSDLVDDGAGQLCFGMQQATMQHILFAPNADGGTDVNVPFACAWLKDALRVLKDANHTPMAVPPAFRSILLRLVPRLADVDDGNVAQLAVETWLWLALRLRSLPVLLEVAQRLLTHPDTDASAGAAVDQVVEAVRRLRPSRRVEVPCLSCADQSLHRKETFKYRWQQPLAEKEDVRVVSAAIDARGRCYSLLCSTKPWANPDPTSASPHVLVALRVTAGEWVSDVLFTSVTPKSMSSSQSLRTSLALAHTLDDGAVLVVSSNLFEQVGLVVRVLGDCGADAVGDGEKVVASCVGGLWWETEEGDLSFSEEVDCSPSATFPVDGYPHWHLVQRGELSDEELVFVRSSPQPCLVVTRLRTDSHGYEASLVRRVPLVGSVCAVGTTAGVTGAVRGVDVNSALVVDASPRHTVDAPTKITAWSIQTTAPGVVRVFLLRPLRDVDWSECSFYVVGGATLEIKHDGAHVFPIPAAQQLRALPGDVLGVTNSRIVAVEHVTGTDNAALLFSRADPATLAPGAEVSGSYAEHPLRLLVGAQRDDADELAQFISNTNLVYADQHSVALMSSTAAPRATPEDTAMYHTRVVDVHTGEMLCAAPALFGEATEFKAPAQLIAYHPTQHGLLLFPAVTSLTTQEQGLAATASLKLSLTPMEEAPPPNPSQSAAHRLLSSLETLLLQHPSLSYSLPLHSLVCVSQPAVQRQCVMACGRILHLVMEDAADGKGDAADWHVIFTMTRLLRAVFVMTSPSCPPRSPPPIPTGDGDSTESLKQLLFRAVDLVDGCSEPQALRVADEVYALLAQAVVLFFSSVPDLEGLFRDCSSSPRHAAIVARFHKPLVLGSVLVTAPGALKASDRLVRTLLGMGVERMGELGAPLMSLHWLVLAFASLDKKDAATPTHLQEYLHMLLTSLLRLLPQCDADTDESFLFPMLRLVASSLLGGEGDDDTSGDMWKGVVSSQWDTLLALLQGLVDKNNRDLDRTHASWLALQRWEWASTRFALPRVTVDSEHPYTNNMNSSVHVSLLSLLPPVVRSQVSPHQLQLLLAFDRRCSTEASCDVLSGYRDTQRRHTVHGDRGWQGNTFPMQPVAVEGGEVMLAFRSDSSNVEWGYRAVATLAEECSEDILSLVVSLNRGALLPAVGAQRLVALSLCRVVVQELKECGVGKAPPVDSSLRRWWGSPLLSALRSECTQRTPQPQRDAQRFLRLAACAMREEGGVVASRTRRNSVTSRLVGKFFQAEQASQLESLHMAAALKHCASEELLRLLERDGGEEVTWGAGMEELMWLIEGQRRLRRWLLSFSTADESSSGTRDDRLAEAVARLQFLLDHVPVAEHARAAGGDVDDGREEEVPVGTPALSRHISTQSMLSQDDDLSDAQHRMWQEWSLWRRTVARQQHTPVDDQTSANAHKGYPVLEFVQSADFTQDSLQRCIDSYTQRASLLVASTTKLQQLLQFCQQSGHPVEMCHVGDVCSAVSSVIREHDDEGSPAMDQGAWMPIVHRLAGVACVQDMVVSLEGVVRVLELLELLYSRVRSSSHSHLVEHTTVLRCMVRCAVLLHGVGMEQTREDMEDDEFEGFTRHKSAAQCCVQRLLDAVCQHVADRGALSADDVDVLCECLVECWAVARDGAVGGHVVELMVLHCMARCCHQQAALQKRLHQVILDKKLHHDVLEVLRAVHLEQPHDIISFVALLLFAIEETLAVEELLTNLADQCEHPSVSLLWARLCDVAHQQRECTPDGAWRVALRHFVMGQLTEDKDKGDKKRLRVALRSVHGRASLLPADTTLVQRAVAMVQSGCEGGGMEVEAVWLLRALCGMLEEGGDRHPLFDDHILLDCTTRVAFSSGTTREHKKPAWWTRTCDGTQELEELVEAMSSWLAESSSTPPATLPAVHVQLSHRRRPLKLSKVLERLSSEGLLERSQKDTFQTEFRAFGILSADERVTAQEYAAFLLFRQQRLDDVEKRLRDSGSQRLESFLTYKRSTQAPDLSPSRDAYMDLRLEDYLGHQEQLAVMHEEQDDSPYEHGHEEDVSEEEEEESGWDSSDGDGDNDDMDVSSVVWHSDQDSDEYEHGSYCFSGTGSETGTDIYSSSEEDSDEEEDSENDLMNEDVEMHIGLYNGLLKRRKQEGMTHSALGVLDVLSLSVSECEWLDNPGEEDYTTLEVLQPVLFRGHATQLDCVSGDATVKPDDADTPELELADSRVLPDRPHVAWLSLNAVLTDEDGGEEEKEEKEEKEEHDERDEVSRRLHTRLSTAYNEYTRLVVLSLTGSDCSYQLEDQQLRITMGDHTHSVDVGQTTVPVSVLITRDACPLAAVRDFYGGDQNKSSPAAQLTNDVFKSPVLLVERAVRAAGMSWNVPEDVLDQYLASHPVHEEHGVATDQLAYDLFTAMAAKNNGDADQHQHQHDDDEAEERQCDRSSDGEETDDNEEPMAVASLWADFWPLPALAGFNALLAQRNLREQQEREREHEEDDSEIDNQDADSFLDMFSSVSDTLSDSGRTRATATSDRGWKASFEDFTPLSESDDYLTRYEEVQTSFDPPSQRSTSTSISPSSSRTPLNHASLLAALRAHHSHAARAVQELRLSVAEVGRRLLVANCRRLLHLVLSRSSRVPPVLLSDVTLLLQGMRVLSCGERQNTDDCKLQQEMETNAHLLRSLEKWIERTDGQENRAVLARACVAQLVRSVGHGHLSGPISMKSVHESNHPYANDTTIVRHCSFPRSTTRINIEFDQENCQLESSCDELLFYKTTKDLENDSPFKTIDYESGSEFKPFFVPGNTLHFRFRTDSSRTFWGYKFTATAVGPLPTQKELLSRPDTTLGVRLLRCAVGGDNAGAEELRSVTMIRLLLQLIQESTSATLQMELLDALRVVVKSGVMVKSAEEGREAAAELMKRQWRCLGDLCTFVSTQEKQLSDKSSGSTLVRPVFFHRCMLLLLQIGEMFVSRTGNSLRDAFPDDANAIWLASFADSLAFLHLFRQQMQSPDAECRLALSSQDFPAVLLAQTTLPHAKGTARLSVKESSGESRSSAYQLPDRTQLSYFCGRSLSSPSQLHKPCDACSVAADLVCGGVMRNQSMGVGGCCQCRECADVQKAAQEQDKDISIRVVFRAKFFQKILSMWDKAQRKTIKSGRSSRGSSVFATFSKMNLDFVTTVLAMREAEEVFPVFACLHILNEHVQRLLPFARLNDPTCVLAQAIVHVKEYVLPGIKSHWLDLLVGRNRHMGADQLPVSVNRIRATRSIQTLREAASTAPPPTTGHRLQLEALEDSVLAQLLHCLKTQNASRLRQCSAHDNLWKVTLEGEGASDQGGPYRESLTDLFTDFSSVEYGLLQATPDSRSGDGNVRLMPISSHQTTSDYLSYMHWLGVFMGVAFRCLHKVDLDVYPLVWKYLCDPDSLGVDDLLSVDGLAHRCLTALQGMADGHQERLLPLLRSVVGQRRVVILSDGSEVPLTDGGDRLSVFTSSIDTDEHQSEAWQRCGEWAQACVQRRVHEVDASLAAMRSGLACVLPVELFRVFTWQQLQCEICGEEGFDVQLLRRHTSYENGLHGHSPAVLFFWQALETFTVSQRKRWLRFVCGRSKLPREEEFHETFNLSAMDGGNEKLPVAHTCFFRMDLPSYTSLENCRRKLLFAIDHCLAIDKDFNASRSSW